MDVTWSYESTHGKLDRIERMLERLTGKVDEMSVDQAAFDAILAAYIQDVDNGVAALVAAAQSAAPAADFSAEVAQINAAKATFDSAVAQAPQSAPPSEPQVPTEGPAVVAGVSGDPTGPNEPDDLEIAAGVTAAGDPVAASPVLVPGPQTSAPVEPDPAVSVPGEAPEVDDGSVAPPAPDAVDEPVVPPAPAPDAA